MAGDSVDRAKILIGDRRYKEAIALLDEHLSSDGTDARARRWLANAYYESGDYAEAEEELHILVALPTPSAPDRFTLARSLEKQGRVDEARHWMAAAAQVDPKWELPRKHLKRLNTPTTSQNSPGEAAPHTPQTNQPTAHAQNAPPRQKELSELVLPSDRAQVEEYRTWGRAQWWTQNWYSLPLPVRIVKGTGFVLSSVLLIAIFIGVGYGFFRLFTSPPIPPGSPASAAHARTPAMTTTRPPESEHPLADRIQRS
jgi:tetratricopeptide (TPR) repeat protein